MPKARAKTRGGATGTPAGPAPPRGRSAAATTMVSAAAEPRRRATSRRAPPRAPADPAWPVDHGQLRAIIQDVVREALDAAPANAAATSTSAAACADNYSPALPPTPLLAAGPAGMTYVTPEASGDDTSTVSTALRQRIHDGKYVELGLLLDAADKISEGNAASFQLVNGALRPISRPPRPILTFGAWCIAFSRFAGVYVEAHPGAAGGLLAHLRQVGQLTGSGLGLAWKEYDESFRRARETAPHLHPWGVPATSSALWLQAVARGIGGAARPGPSAPRPASAGRFRPCFAFNSPKGCTSRPCQYQHLCRACHGSHPLSRCSQSSRPRARGTAPPPAASSSSGAAR